MRAFPCHPLRARKPLAVAILGATLSLHGGLLLPLLSNASQVQAAEASRSYAIPGGPLGAVLSRFAGEAGVVLSFDAALTSGKHSAGLQGSYSVEQGFTTLLSGSGLGVRQDSDGYVLTALQQDAALTLTPTTVSGGSYGDAPHIGYVPSSSRSSTKTGTPLVETPQSISVITREQMDAQKVRTVSQALRYVPGVRVETYGTDPKGYDWLNIRGFNAQATSDYRDGLKQLSNSYSFFRTEPYALERIDVARGPSSSLFGMGDAGGIINRVSKLPTAEGIHQVELQAGNNDHWQGQFDLGDRLDADGQYLYRVVGVVRDANTQFDYNDGHEVRDDHLYLAPSFTWAPNEDTSLTLQTDFLHDRSGGTISVYTPSYGHASDTLLGDHSFNHSDQEQYSLGYQFRHRLNDMAEFRQNLRYGQVDFILNNLQPQGSVPQLGLGGLLPASMANYMVRQPKRFDEHFQAFTVDNQLQLDFDTQGIGHTLLTGVDYSRSDADVKRTYVPLQVAYLGQLLPLLLNPVNPQYGIDVSRPTVRQVDYDQTIEQTGVYAQDQIKFDEHWLLTAGGRYDEVRVETDNYLVPSGSGTVKKHAFTGRAGLTYLTDFGLAPYISYAESFTPNAGVVANSVTEIALDPSEAKQWEAGVKYQPTDRVLLTAAWFDITKTNVPSYRPVTFELTSEGEVRSKGLELEARLKLADAWDLIAAYTYNDVEITKSANANTGNRPMQTPKNMASTWLNYSLLDGSLRGLSIGGGARYVGSTFGDDANQFEVDSYTLFDAGVSYRLDSNITLSLNAQNLLDEKYVASCDSINSCYPGDSRTVLGSVKYDW